MVVAVLFLWSEKNAAQDSAVFTPTVSVRASFSNAVFPVSSMLQATDFARGSELEFLFPLFTRLDLALPMRLGTADFYLNGVPERQVFVGSDVQWHLRYYPAEAGFNVFLLSGYGVQFRAFERPLFQVPMGAGLDIRLAGAVALSGQVTFRKGLSVAPDQWVLGVGIKWFGLSGRSGKPIVRRQPDSDMDGVPDSVDECPLRYGMASMAGCPDSDSDGLSDARDECPDSAGPVRGCPDADSDGIPDKSDACPLEVGTVLLKGCPERDSDGDGLADHLDECPHTSGTIALNGCPDTDGDGIRDADDACPELPGGARTTGCPDTDEDGVEDRADRCPYTPGEGNPTGCPELSPAVRTFLESLSSNLVFSSGSVLLDGSGSERLDSLVGILRRYPDFELLIRTFTKDAKPSEAAAKVAESRAKACYEYLITKGIGPRRMRWEVFAGSNASSPSAAGRNRVIEFLLSPRN